MHSLQSHLPQHMTRYVCLWDKQGMAIHPLQYVVHIVHSVIALTLNL